MVLPILASYHGGSLRSSQANTIASGMTISGKRAHHPTWLIAYGLDAATDLVTHPSVVCWVLRCAVAVVHHTILQHGGVLVLVGVLVVADRIHDGACQVV